ncbi:MAG: nuclear transport factor 2 family protein [Hylemonella sp.]
MNGANGDVGMQDLTPMATFDLESFEFLNAFQAAVCRKPRLVRDGARRAAPTMGVLMITREFAESFSKEWIESWNSHDLDRILSHYSEDFTLSSPYIAQIAGVSSGSLTGKEAVWAAAGSVDTHLSF